MLEKGETTVVIRTGPLKVAGSADSVAAVARVPGAVLEDGVEEVVVIGSRRQRGVQARLCLLDLAEPCTHERLCQEEAGRSALPGRPAHVTEEGAGDGLLPVHRGNEGLCDLGNRCDGPDDPSKVAIGLVGDRARRPLICDEGPGRLRQRQPRCGRAGVEPLLGAGVHVGQAPVEALPVRLGRTDRARARPPPLSGDELGEGWQDASHPARVIGVHLAHQVHDPNRRRLAPGQPIEALGHLGGQDVGDRRSRLQADELELGEPPHPFGDPETDDIARLEVERYQ